MLHSHSDALNNVWLVFYFLKTITIFKFFFNFLKIIMIFQFLINSGKDWLQATDEDFFIVNDTKDIGVLF